MKQKIFNIILTVVLMSTTAFASSLEEFQDMAVKNRKVVEAYKLSVKKARESEKIAKSGYMPSLDVSYTFNSLNEKTTTENDENSVFYSALSWNIFSGFKDKYNIKSAKILTQIEILNLKGIKQDIKYAVSMRYLAIINAKASQSVSEDAYNTLNKIHTDAKNRFEVGVIKKNDLLKIKVDLDNSKIDLKKSQTEFKKSIILLERAVDDDISLANVNFTELKSLPNLDDKETYEGKMIANRSEIEALKLGTEIATLSVKSERSSLYPSVDFTSSYKKYDDDYINGSGNIDTEEIRQQLTISINLFDGFSKYGNISKAKIESKRIRYDLYELIRDLKADLKNKFLDLDVSNENITVAKSSIAQAEENLRITQLSYNEGLSTTSDLLDAIAGLSRAKFNYVTAETEYYANYFTIVRLVEDF